MSLPPLPPPLPHSTQAAAPICLSVDGLLAQAGQLFTVLGARATQACLQRDKGNLLAPSAAAVKDLWRQAADLHACAGAVDKAPLDDTLCIPFLAGLVLKMNELDYRAERKYLVGRIERLILSCQKITSKALSEDIDLGSKSMEAKTYAQEVIERLAEMNTANDSGRGLMKLTAQNTFDQLTRVANQLMRQRRFRLIEKKARYCRGETRDIVSEARKSLAPEDSGHMVDLGAMNKIFDKAVRALEDRD